jgi:chemotaxis protein methyltransferase CheR
MNEERQQMGAVISQVHLKKDDFEKFRAIIYNVAGISLSDAKQQLVQSRLLKRLRHHGLSDFHDYLELLKEEGDTGSEMRFMINCLTTNKTDFFREKHHFDFVDQVLVPALVEQAKKGTRSRRIRVWHAGCSMGQEPYSLAMTLANALRNQGTWDIKLLASDIDTDVLGIADAGVYKQEQIEPVPANLRSAYFKKINNDDGGSYQVVDEIRRMIAFRQINLLETPWPIRADVRFDLLFCRNVVIYFDKPTQQRLFGRYEKVIAPGGYLFIGHSESLFGISEAFESVGGTIYRKPNMRESASS